MLMDLIVASVRPIFGGADYSKGHLSLVIEPLFIQRKDSFFIINNYY
jgi:hypothetical protein